MVNNLISELNKDAQYNDISASKNVYLSVNPSYFKNFAKRTKIHFSNKITLINLDFSKLGDKISKQIRISKQMKELDRQRRNLNK